MNTQTHTLYTSYMYTYKHAHTYKHVHTFTHTNIYTHTHTVKLSKMWWPTYRDRYISTICSRICRYGTAQMQCCALVHESNRRLGAWHPPRLQVLLLFLVGGDTRNRDECHAPLIGDYLSTRNWRARASAMFHLSCTVGASRNIGHKGYEHKHTHYTYTHTQSQCYGAYCTQQI